MLVQNLRRKKEKSVKRKFKSPIIVLPEITTIITWAYFISVLSKCANVYDYSHIYVIASIYYKINIWDFYILWNFYILLAFHILL